MKIKVNWHNTEMVLRRLEKLLEKQERAVTAALMDRAVAVMDKAVALAPKQTGELQKSAYISIRGPGHIEMGFGADHAVEVHERVEVVHANGQAKFLEQAMIDGIQGKMYLVAKRARKYADRGIAPISKKYPQQPG